MMRDRIVNRARAFLGTRWVHQGRTIDGIDCVGLIVLVGQSLGFPVHDFNDYSRRPDHHEFSNYFINGGALPKDFNSALPGDIMVFHEFAYPCHCAILSSKRNVNHIIHSYLPRKMTIEEPFIEFWQNKIAGCFSYPGVE